MKPVPGIQSPVQDVDRPFWSVMIPTYKPDPQYLDKALASVLQQDPGPERMQIAVVDDQSPDDVAERAAMRAGPRVEFHRRERNGGMAKNWNNAVDLARGEWVHLLHQDDLVLPGFYQKLSDGISERGDLGAAYVQHYLLDGGEGRRLMSDNPASEAGVVENWMQYVFVYLSIQTPSVVVRRRVYEDLGGFREDFRYALDWDMWKRIAAKYPIWFDPEPLACYRRHDDGASMSFLASGGNMEEVRRSIDLSRNYLPPEDREPMAKASRRRYSDLAIDAGVHALVAWRDVRIAQAQFREARLFEVEGAFAPRVAKRIAAGFGRWVKDCLARPIRP